MVFYFENCPDALCYSCVWLFDLLDLLWAVKNAEPDRPKITTSNMEVSSKVEAQQVMPHWHLTSFLISSFFLKLL